MIFHDARCIFFHPGKTAGTAIEAAFGYTNETHNPHDKNLHVFKGWDSEHHIYLQHASAAFMHARIKPQIWQSYFKFAAIRNPFERLISAYHFQHVHRRKFGNFTRLVESLPELMSSGQLSAASHFLPLTDYCFVDGKKVVDALVRFEHVDADLQKIARRIGKPLTLRRVNTATGPERPTQSAATVYTSAMAEIVREVYAADFEIFDYPTEPPGH